MDRGEGGREVHRVGSPSCLRHHIFSLLRRHGISIFFEIFMLQIFTAASVFSWCSFIFFYSPFFIIFSGGVDICFIFGINFSLIRY